MSFILEALKQAEQERGAGKLPSVMSVYHDAAEQQQAIDWKKWLAIAIFINAVILSVWIGWRLLSTPSDNELVQAVGQNKQAVPEKVETDSSGFFVEPEQEQTAPVEENESVLQEEHIDRSMVTPKQIRPDEQLVEKEQSVSTLAEAPVQVIATQQPLEPEMEITKVIEDSPQQEVDTKQVVVNNASPLEINVAKVEPLPVAKPAESIEQDVVQEIAKPELKQEAVAIAVRPEVPEFAELPYSLQQKIPDIRISVHIFNDEPSQRKARINGRIFREGEQVERGLLVEQITPRGVMFDYKGTVFRVSLR